MIIVTHLFCKTYPLGNRAVDRRQINEYTAQKSETKTADERIDFTNDVMASVVVYYLHHRALD